MAKINYASPELTEKVNNFIALKHQENLFSKDSFRKYKLKKIRKRLNILSFEIEQLLKKESYI